MKWPGQGQMADVSIQVSKLSSLAPEDFPMITCTALPVEEAGVC